MNKDIELTGGDPMEHNNRGRFHIETMPSGAVCVSFPDRKGNTGTELMTFAPEDWDTIVAAVNEAELHRGKVVSTEWRIQR